MKAVLTTAEIVKRDGTYHPAIKHGEKIIILHPEYAKELGTSLILAALQAATLNAEES